MQFSLNISCYSMFICIFCRVFTFFPGPPVSLSIFRATHDPRLPSSCPLSCPPRSPESSLLNFSSPSSTITTISAQLSFHFQTPPSSSLLRTHRSSLSSSHSISVSMLMLLLSAHHFSILLGVCVLPCTNRKHRILNVCRCFLVLHRELSPPSSLAGSHLLLC